jgi:ubiquinone biosynthesis protein UbiJ
MPNREIKNTTRVVQLKTYASTNADTRTAYVDLQGWDAALFVVDNGALTVATTGTNEFDIKVIHADATPAAVGSYTEAATTDVVGPLPVLGDANTTAQTRTVGYVGNKRYVALFIDETGDVTADVGVYAILQKFSREASGAVTVTSGAIS